MSLLVLRHQREFISLFLWRQLDKSCFKMGLFYSGEIVFVLSWNTKRLKVPIKQNNDRVTCQKVRVNSNKQKQRQWCSAVQNWSIEKPLFMIPMFCFYLKMLRKDYISQIHIQICVFPICVIWSWHLFSQKKNNDNIPLSRGCN